MNINQVSIQDYLSMEDSEKEKFFKKIKPEFSFKKVYRMRKTKNMKEFGYKQQNGFLTFIDEIKRTDVNMTNFYYLCVCDCGNWHILLNNHFNNNNTISCGCKKNELLKEKCKNTKKNFFDISNQTFGELKVLYPTDKRLFDCIVWMCECINCGGKQEVSGSMLRRGSRSFCEYCSKRRSKGELIISKILKDNNLFFEQEKKFIDCKFPDTKYYAYFDFYVEDKYLIEFDGQQHFQPEAFNNLSKNKAIKIFAQTKERDNFKNQWCEMKGIPLIRIPYTAINQLSVEDLKPETSRFLI